jgi:hypothetical protein
MNAPLKAPAIGDNRGPLITADQLAVDFAHIEAFVAGLEAKAKDVPPAIEDDEDLALVNEIVPKLRAGAKRCDEVRDQEKRPYLDAGTTVQTFFKAFENRLLTLKTDLESRGGRYLKKKADAERIAREEEARKAREEEARQRAQAEAAEAAARRAREDAEKAEAECAKAATRADAGALTKAALAKAAAGVEAEAATARAQAEQKAASEAAAQTAVLEKAATAKTADLARTHTVGGTSTLLEAFEPKVADFTKVDLLAIRAFIREDEIMLALRAYARANKDELKAGRGAIGGVTFVLTTKGSFR